MKKGGLTLRIFLVIILNDLIDGLAQLLMKKGLIQTEINLIHFSTFVEFITRNSSSILVWIGILAYTLNFFLWIAILSRVELSIAIPVGSTTYVLIPLLASLFLNEHVSMLRWIGISFIIVGIHFVSKSVKPGLEASPQI